MLHSIQCSTFSQKMNRKLHQKDEALSDFSHGTDVKKYSFTIFNLLRRLRNHHVVVLQNGQAGVLGGRTPAQRLIGGKIGTRVYRFPILATYIHPMYFPCRAGCQSARPAPKYIRFLFINRRRREVESPCLIQAITVPKVSEDIKGNTWFYKNRYCLFCCRFSPNLRSFFLCIAAQGGNSLPPHWRHYNSLYP